jgi:hypothetical protein
MRRHPAIGDARLMEVADSHTIWFDRNSRGAWEVGIPDRRERVACETIDDARRVAYLCAARRHPCELIVRDAYHRVIHREFFDGGGDPGGGCESCAEELQSLQRSEYLRARRPRTIEAHRRRRARLPIS